MSGIPLRMTAFLEKPGTGRSKVFGNPDVGADFVWPQMEENGETYDLTFLCQINCAQVAAWDTDGLLPQTGMLYFFYDLDGMPETPENSRSARVIWYDGADVTLREMMLTDESGNGMTFREQEILPQAPSEARSVHRLLGDKLFQTAYAPLLGWQPLLRLGSFETEEATIVFANGGALEFYIEPEKLAARDFSDVRAAQIQL